MRIKVIRTVCLRLRRARLCDAGVGGNPGPHQGDRPHQARLSDRRKAVLLDGRLGQPDGYGVEVCQARRRTAQDPARPAGHRRRLGGGGASKPASRKCRQGNIDLLCPPTSVTLAKRKQVSFSIAGVRGRYSGGACAPMPRRPCVTRSRGRSGLTNRYGAARRRRDPGGHDVRGRLRDDARKTWLKERGAAARHQGQGHAGSGLSHRHSGGCSIARWTCSSATAP